MLNEIILDYPVGPKPKDKYSPTAERRHVKAEAENNTATSQVPGPAEAGRGEKGLSPRDIQRTALPHLEFELPGSRKGKHTYVALSRPSGLFHA